MTVNWKFVIERPVDAFPAGRRDVSNPLMLEFVLWAGVQGEANVDCVAECVPDVTVIPISVKLEGYHGTRQIDNES